jgi:hypothetical protein
VAACSLASAGGMTSTQAQRNRGEAMPYYQFTVPAGSTRIRLLPRPDPEQVPDARQETADR